MRQLKLAVVLFAAALCCFAACDNAGAPAGANEQARNANTDTSASTAPPPAAATTTTTTALDELAPARATYDACVRCHKENGEGGTVEFDGDTLRVPSFKQGHALNHTDAQFARQIANGGDGMPAFKSRLSAEQINDLVRFVRREFQAGLVPAAEKTDTKVGESK
ncbi:MAG: c-type cytochrome [Pyrinomonadaceae bacterium]